MKVGDPRFETFPDEVGVDQLRWYITQTARDALSIHEFIAGFRAVHEAAERAGHPEYASQEEARAIWDVLWAVEFCSADISREDHPEDWYIPEEVLVTVKRAAAQLKSPD